MMNTTTDKIIQFPNDERIEEEAAHWCVKMMDDLTPDDDAKLQIWLAKSSTHRKFFVSMAHSLDQMEQLAPLAEVFPHEPIKKTKPFSYRYMGLAASLVLGFVFTFTWFTSQDVSNELVSAPAAEQQQVNEQQYYSTKVGEIRTVMLPDGSALLMNTNTNVNINYTKDRRELLLTQGEIHITVAHNKLRPLSVDVGGKTIEAVGTAFNIEYARNEVIELIVTDGTVKVFDQLQTDEIASDYVSINVEVGRQLAIDGKTDITPDLINNVSLTSDVNQTLAWQSRYLVFTGLPLEDMVIEITRYTGVAIEIADSDLKQVKIVGRFKTNDLDSVLSSLDKSFDIKYHWKGDKMVVLSKK